MQKVLKLLFKPIRIVTHRLRTQGVATTVKWGLGRGISKLTGALVLSHSRVTPSLYVGPQFGKLGKRQLEQAGVNGDVNMRSEFDDAAHGLALAEYCHLPTVDETPPTVNDLRAGVEFIAQVIDSGGKVYIHCAGGVGRAPTMAAAYLITQGMALDDAVALIHKARPYIDILPDQFDRLREFELSHTQGQPA